MSIDKLAHALKGLDLDGMTKAFSRVIEAHAYGRSPFHQPVDADAALALRELRAILPGLKALAAQTEQQAEPVAWCSLTQSGKIGYFDGKPMVMVGPVGNELHETALYTRPPAAQQERDKVAGDGRQCPNTHDPDCRWPQCLCRDREAIKDQQEQDKEDAERYRWLRDVSVPPHNFYISVPVEFDGVRYTPAEVDAAIDAARALAGGTK